MIVVCAPQKYAALAMAVCRPQQHAAPQVSIRQAAHPAGQPPSLWRGRCKPSHCEAAATCREIGAQQQRICDGQLHRLVVFGVAAARCAKDEAGGVLGGARMRLRVSQHAKRSAGSSTTVG